MPLNLAARRFLDIAAIGARASASFPGVDDMRRSMAQLATFADAPNSGVETRDLTIAGPEGAMRIRVYSPEECAPTMAPGLVYFHGGGWISGNLDTHDGVCRLLALDSGVRVIAVDYRLAPEHRFPAAIDDCRAALDHVAAHAADYGLDPARIGVAGDSAGGNLAIVVTQAAKRSGPPIALQVLLCPVIDALAHTPSRETMASGWFLDERTMRLYWESYCIGGQEDSDPRVSPLRGDEDFAGSPPALIHSAEFDPLRDEAQLFAETLTRAGVDARLTCHPGVIHHFYGLSGVIPAARDAMRAVGADISAAFARLS
jgi:acetyl esterase/lipase